MLEIAGKLEVLRGCIIKRELGNERELPGSQSFQGSIAKLELGNKRMQEWRL
jgi:hypothetical protein